MIWPLVLLPILITCSFAISGSETALFALSVYDRQAFAVSPSRFRRLASRLMQRPRQVLMTVLIVNTAVNIGIFAVSYVTFGALAAAHPLIAGVGGVVTLLAVIVFGEILPKAAALTNARRLAPLAAPLVHTLQVVTAPLRVVLRVGFVEPIVRLAAPAPSAGAEVSTADLSALVQLSADRGIISSREHEMLQTVVALPEIAVREVMTPRVEIIAAPIGADRAQVERLLQTSGLKKLPVFGRDLDDIRGLLYARDFYLNPQQEIAELLRPVRYIPELVNLLQLLRHFRNTRTQLAVVVDEYGGVSGIVAVEDVLEEIVGELDAGPEPAEPEVERLDERTYRLAGAVNIRPWRQMLGITERFHEVSTLGGLVVASLERMPRVGDGVHFGNLTITVDRLAGRRVDRVILRAEPLGEAGEARR